MPTSLSFTSTYAGEAAAKYLAAALLASKSIDNVTVHTDIPYRQVFRKYANAAGFVNATCDFTDTGTVTVSEFYLDPKRLTWDQEICKKDVIRDWQTKTMGASLLGQNLPTDLQEMQLAYMAALAGQYVEQTIWTGDATVAGQFDGILNQFSAIDVNGTTLTAANIIAQLGLVVNAIPTAIKAYRGDDLNIYVPTSVIFLYEEAQSALGAADMFHERQATPNFRGIPLVECPGMPDNTIVAARKSNLHFGTSLVDDLNKVAMLDMEQTTLDRNVRFHMSISGDTAIGFEGEAVYYAVPAS